MGDEERIDPLTLWVDELGIVHIRYSDNIRITLEIAKEEVRRAHEAGGGGKVVELVDLTNVGSVDREARMFYAGEEASQVLAAAALLTKSLAGRVIGNFFLGINKPQTPVKLFDEEREAIEWLLQFKSKS